MDNMMKETPIDDLADLEAMFGQENQVTQKAERIVLTQNLDGFSSCFPEWDLHPPVNP